MCICIFVPLTIVNVYRNGIQGIGYGFLPMMAGVAELSGRGIMAVIAGKQAEVILEFVLQVRLHGFLLPFCF